MVIQHLVHHPFAVSCGHLFGGGLLRVSSRDGQAGASCGTVPQKRGTDPKASHRQWEPPKDSPASPRGAPLPAPAPESNPRLPLSIDMPSPALPNRAGGLRKLRLRVTPAIPLFLRRGGPVRVHPPEGRPARSARRPARNPRWRAPGTQQPCGRQLAF